MNNFLLFTLTSILLIVSPGPGNILAMARGVSQGPAAALVSSISSGFGILLHVLFATLGLTALLLTSAVAFTIVKIAGAIYLIWLGLKAIRTQSFISFEKTEQVSMSSVAVSGFLTAALSPKIGAFMLAFIPQFISDGPASAVREMAVLGTWFAVLTTLVFSLMGVCSHMLTEWFRSRPKTVRAVNAGAGAALITSGVSLVFAERS